jgi:hypothetical protein
MQTALALAIWKAISTAQRRPATATKVFRALFFFGA